MSTTIERSFETRREADLAIEHLVQEQGVTRTDIFVVAQGDTASAGSRIGGGDASAPGEDARGDAPLESLIILSVDVQDDDRAAELEAALDQLATT